ncbi:biopolymer transporter ExbD [Horticoccus luteus]|uniref:Biopolymer transporter ExbD n=1 Tax=Horticoccus luteus TaxID=2862869 RepID=A0A8F9XKY6_9BACT|nr:biopolymer transporter ExbD [Horticoccus luteus]QYM78519.1 biopolymer transporter ExbD [Horticoccus luteus]
MSGSSGGGKKSARIEIIPLIDVIFFLLATFVLFTLSLNKSEGLPVSLPGSETGEARDPTGSHTITITQEGTLAWDKDPVTLDEFQARLAQYKTDLHPKILINGDENAMFSQAIYVFDEVRKAGISKVLVETKVRPPSS